MQPQRARHDSRDNEKPNKTSDTRNHSSSFHLQLLNGNRPTHDSVLEVLLALVLTSVVLSFWRFGACDAAVLPKQPDSIAFRLVLLAGSSLVRRLRADGVERAGDMDVWEEVARLGWWRIEANDDSFRTGDGSGRMWRWGIDVREGVRLAGWNEPPEDGDMGKAPGEAQDGQRVEEGDAAGQRRVDSLPVPQSLLQSEEDLSSEGQPDVMTQSESNALMRRGTW